MRFHISDDRVDIAQHCHRLGPLAFISPVRIHIRSVPVGGTMRAPARFDRAVDLVTGGNDAMISRVCR